MSAVLGLASPCLAEPFFEGGPGDGADRSGTVQVFLNGAGGGTAALYLGGVADGHVVGRISGAGLNGTTGLADLFFGGHGDGATVTLVASSLSGLDLAVLFSGGPGDGNDRGILWALDLTGGGSLSTLLYGGGPGDGADQSPASWMLSGLSSAVFFSGGPGDGATVTPATVALEGASLAALYSGGPGDGHDLLILTDFPLEVAKDSDGDLIPDIVDLDDDNDGMPDLWELFFGFNSLDPADAALDEDGDGKSNLEEYIADTDPTDALSFFHVFARLNIDGLPEIVFDSSPNRLYTMELSEELNVWVASGATLPGTGPEDSRLIPFVLPKNFARIVVSVP